MVIDEISYKSFRCIEEAKIIPCGKSNVNILIGNNAEGKTAALEGIYMFAQGRSFRGAVENELIRFGDEIASLELVFSDKNRKQRLEMRFSRDGKRRFVRNGVSMPRLSEFIGCFRAVVFCPDDLSIVRDGPAVRRRMLDSAISQLDPAYLRELQKYGNILTQRNSLVKNYYNNPQAYNSTIGVWSDELADSAEIIAKKRYEYTEKLNAAVRKIFSDMTENREEPSLLYTAPRSAAEYREQLAASREREIKAGVTLCGIHRGDIDVKLNGRAAKIFSSQGQQRSIAMAVKIAEGKISKDETGDAPVYLFDDIFSELDSHRREFLLCGLGEGQIFITSCESPLKTGTVFHVKSGTYRRGGGEGCAGDF